MPHRRAALMLIWTLCFLCSCELKAVSPIEPVPLEGTWILTKLNGTPPPVVALSVGTRSIEILEARLEIAANDSLRYHEYRRYGETGANGKTVWEQPSWAVLPGMIYDKPGSACDIEFRIEDAILVLTCEYQAGEAQLMIIVPEGSGVPERRLQFERIAT